MAEILDQSQAVFVRERGQIGARHGFGKAQHREIAAMDGKQGTRGRRDGGAVIGQARLVRGAHFDQPRATLGNDVGDAEAAADFDQLAAGDEDLAAGGERGERQQHGGGVVVDRDGGRGAGERADQGLDGLVAAAARAAAQIVFQRAVRGRFGHGGDGGRGQRRPAKIGVQHDAGGVDDAVEARSLVKQTRGLVEQGLGGNVRGRAIQQGRAGLTECAAQGGEHRGAAMAGEQRRSARCLQQGIDLRQGAQV